jgi:SAM-dependent methyltransferase
MDPPTDAPPSSSDLAGRFYDALAPEYDAMTGFERRFEAERPFFAGFVAQYAVRRAVDAGAGTGFHALLLAQLGVRVVAVDVSADMLAIARAHAVRMGCPVNVLRASLLELARDVVHPQDAVVCMGNTLAHFTEPGARADVLAQFCQVLACGGVALIQTLNFDRIMREATHLQSVREAEGWTFVREYRPAGAFVDLRITRTPASGGRVAGAEAAAPSVSTVRLLPVFSEDLVGELAGVGFSDIRLHGSTALDPFSPLDSRDLVVLCRKP